MTNHINNRIDIYGPSTCPICGNRRETIHAGERYQLTCRDHPGHPLYEEGPARYTTREGLASKTDIIDTGLASERL